MQKEGPGMNAKKKSETTQEAGAPARTFDPRPYLRTIKSGKWEAEYLDVKWRLAWMRTEHPDARITTEHVLLDEDSAVFRAMVQIPGGGCATGYGSETRGDWADFIEKAETKAIGRALAALGYGTQFALDFDFDVDPTRPRVVDSPVERDGGRRGRRAETEGDEAEAAQPAGRRGRAAAGPRSEWDEFWRWARPLGYQNKDQLEELFGHSIEGMTPREVREELTEYRSTHGLEEDGEAASPE
jgi:hypothetical protein